MRLALVAAAGAPGEDRTTESQAFRGEVSVGYVLVPWWSRARNGFAERLTRRDFGLRVDGRLVPVESFESGADAPIGVLFLQDLSGSMDVARSSHGAASSSAASWIARRRRVRRRLVQRRKLFVEVPFPGSPRGHRRGRRGWRGYGRTALHDAVAWLPDIVQSRARRGEPSCSSPTAWTMRARSGGRAREEIRQAEVPVHVVGLETGSIEALHSAGGKMHRLADMLNLIGWATGGGYPSVDSSSEVRSACHAIVEDLRHQYVLGFSTRADGDPARHDIEVELPGKARSCGYTIAVAMRGRTP